MPNIEGPHEPGSGGYAADYPVREYVAAMAVELASMARWDGDEKLASALLSPVPTPRDELVRALDMPIGVVAAALLELSLAGRASLLPGGLASV